MAAKLAFVDKRRRAATSPPAPTPHSDCIVLDRPFASSESRAEAFLRSVCWRELAATSAARDIRRRADRRPTNSADAFIPIARSSKLRKTACARAVATNA
jgi:hypothetical protein